jgi:hypothetical protein
MTMEHWTQILANVSLWEFVLLAALTFGQWLRHRIRGAGWAALAFGIIGGISVVAKVDPGIVTNETTVKVLIAVLMLVPYCLFQFAASFLRPRAVVQYAVAAVTVAVIAFTFALQYVPEPGAPPPPYFATSSSGCSWPDETSPASPSTACACSPSPRPGSNSRSWWPPWAFRAPRCSSRTSW